MGYLVELVVSHFKFFLDPCWSMLSGAWQAAFEWIRQWFFARGWLAPWDVIVHILVVLLSLASCWAAYWCGIGLERLAYRVGGKSLVWFGSSWLLTAPARLLWATYTGQLSSTLNWWIELLGTLLGSFLSLLAIVGSLLCSLIVAMLLLTFVGNYLDAEPESQTANAGTYFGVNVIQADRNTEMKEKTSEPGMDSKCTALNITSSAFTQAIVRLSEQVVVSLLLLTLSGTLMLYGRFGFSAGMLFTDRDDLSQGDPREALLPSQQAAYDEILARVEMQRREQSSLVIGMDGEWGAGKSRIVEALRQRLRPRARVAIDELKADLRGNEGTSAGDKTWLKFLRRCFVAPRKNQIGFGKILSPGFASSHFDKHNRGSGVSEHEKRNWPEGHPDAILISLNIWRYRNEQDIHWALLEALLDHPLSPPGWRIPVLGIRTTNLFRYPYRLIVVYAMRLFAQTFSQGRMSLPGGMAFSVNLSGMLWQRQLDLVLDAQWEAKRTVIWCLDEIDRTSPEIAQAALTLSRRFLTHRGTTVLIPYNEPQLAYKAFNPLTTLLPDLQSNCDSVLWNQIEDHSRKRPHDPGLGSRLGLQHSFGMAGDSGAATGGPIVPPGPFTPTDILPSGINVPSQEAIESLLNREPSCTLERRVKWELLSHYLSSSPRDRVEIQFRFQEKYLRQANLKLKRLQPEDVRAILTLESFQEIHSAVTEILCADKTPEDVARNTFEPDRNNLGVAAEWAIRRLWSERPFGYVPRPVLRHFADELRVKLVSLVALAKDIQARRDASSEPRSTIREMWARWFPKSDIPPLTSNDALWRGLILLVTTIAYVRAGNRLLPELSD